MNVFWLIAALLVLLGTLVHSIAGEMTDIKALMGSNDIEMNLKIELQLGWYVVAADMGASGLYLLYFAFDPMDGATLLTV